MKKRIVTKIIGLSMAAVVFAASPAVLWAAESTEETEQKTEQDNRSDEDGASLEKGEDIRFSLREIQITNETSHNFKTVEYVQDETVNGQWNLNLMEENGEMHIFENVSPEDWNTPVLTDEYGFLYIQYQDENGEQQEELETVDDADENVFEQPVMMYATTRVNVREKPSTEAQAVMVTALAEEWKAVAALPGWIRVERDDAEGYIYHSYLTEDKEKVEAELKAQQEAAAADAAAQQAAADAAAQQAAADAAAQQAAEEAAAQAAAEAAAQAAAEAAAEAAAQQAAEEVPQIYEVSRQAFDDCDGSGHGYYEITYSDGSVAYEYY